MFEEVDLLTIVNFPLVKAKVVYAPKRVYLPYGKPGILECFYKANPEITKIRWEKDGFLFDAYNVPGVFSRKNGSLYFSKVGIDT